jgi:CDP-glycerol glycerophosphotransferase (TagB/SpsB family)
MEKLAAQHPNVQLKFKNSSPDSLVDMLVSSALISNYSSFLNAFYHTGKPSIHIDPLPRDGGPSYQRHLRWGRLRVKKVKAPLSSWKLPPSDVGGLVAHGFSELLSSIDRALDDPRCCEGLSADFNRRHVSAADGRTSERIARELQTWISGGATGA